VRRRTQRAATVSVDSGLAGRFGAAVTQHPRESVAILTAAATTLVIFINALYLQRGPHPAPIFGSRQLTKQDRLAVLPHRRPAEAGGAAAIVRTRAQLVGEIQRALAERGFYEGAIDGIWGARTDGAVRDFTEAGGTRVDAEASESLLRTIKGSEIHAQAASAAGDPIAQLLTPSKRVLAVQRALADFGYGQITPTGIEDVETRAAIERFERDRRLPVTGTVSDRLVRELAAMTGRPLE
jgi:peptidoglycan hydrolase-like protein with peptidoglycan-binding domain